MFLFYFFYITFIHSSSQINFKTFPLFLPVCRSYLLQLFSIHMIHRKLHSLRCGVGDITFICYGSCRPRPSGIPALYKYHGSCKPRPSGIPALYNCYGPCKPRPSGIPTLYKYHGSCKPCPSGIPALYKYYDPCKPRPSETPPSGIPALYNVLPLLSWHECAYDLSYMCECHCVHACLRACVFACLCACMFACMHVCVNACFRACMFACLHVYVCQSVRVGSHFIFLQQLNGSNSMGKDLNCRNLMTRERITRRETQTERLTTGVVYTRYSDAGQLRWTDATATKIRKLTTFCQVFI